MPTTSVASKKFAQASRSFFAPVSERMPRDSISATVPSSTLSVAESTDFSECTRTALPANGPGIPGFGEGAKRLTTRYLGISVAVAALALAMAASCRKSRRCIVTRYRNCLWCVLVKSAESARHKNGKHVGTHEKPSRDPQGALFALENQRDSWDCSPPRPA